MYRATRNTLATRRVGSQDRGLQAPAFGDREFAGEQAEQRQQRRRDVRPARSGGCARLRARYSGRWRRCAVRCTGCGIKSLTVAWCMVPYSLARACAEVVTKWQWKSTPEACSRVVSRRCGSSIGCRSTLLALHGALMLELERPAGTGLVAFAFRILPAVAAAMARRAEADPRPGHADHRRGGAADRRRQLVAHGACGWRCCSR